MPPMEDSMVVDSSIQPPPTIMVSSLDAPMLKRMPWALLIAVKDVREICKWIDQNIVQFVTCFLSNNVFFFMFHMFQVVEACMALLYILP